ncbi:hypothetical protein GCM10009799_20420 [Nocardiopsis rhodophaea]|uniref:Uncharacterized protein n=1 Tax=Nocardiopsis rhodophaea TaxID=280238 RepID=A0ABN2SYE1_9ACTN
MQQWLKERREAAARAAQLRICRKCKEPVLVGVDADMCALTVQIDPTPITEVGEAVALMEGRGTYDLLAGKGRREIHHRAEWNIRAARRGPVFAAHRCHRPMTDHLDTTHTHRPANPGTDTDTPPY